MDTNEEKLLPKRQSFGPLPAANPSGDYKQFHKSSIDPHLTSPYQGEAIPSPW
jgi:hypothetical protein